MKFYQNPIVIGLFVVLVVASVLIFYPYEDETSIEDTFVGGQRQTVGLQLIQVTSGPTSATIRGDKDAILRSDGKSKNYDDYYITSRDDAGYIYQYYYFDATNLERLSAEGIKEMTFQWTGCLSCKYLCYYAHQEVYKGEVKVDLIGKTSLSTLSIHQGGAAALNEYNSYDFTYDGLVLEDHLYTSGSQTFLIIRLYLKNPGASHTNCNGGFIYSEYVPSLTVTYDLEHDAPYSAPRGTHDIQGSARIDCNG